MRCNVGIDPSKLTDEQLFAESRELKFLPAYYKKYGTKSISKVPQKFTLGKGHILFFAFKPTYSLNRYKKVIAECICRKIDVKDESYRWKVYGNITDSFTEEKWMADILKERIMQKIDSSNKKSFHYNHKPITKNEAKMLLK